MARWSGSRRRASTWASWTVVTTTVSGPISPASEATANSRSEKPPPLPSRAPSRPAATVPGHHQVDRLAAGRARPAGPRLDAPLIDDASRAEPARLLGIEEEERLLLGQPGHGHEQQLPVLQRPLPDGPLRRVGVGLERAGRLPGVGAPQQLGRSLGADEVGDPALRRRETGSPWRPGAPPTPPGGARPWPPAARRGRRRHDRVGDGSGASHDTLPRLGLGRWP